MPVQIVNETPLALGFVAGRVSSTGLHLTTIVKGSFRLVAGEAAVVDERPLLGGDTHVDDDPARRLVTSTDFAPWKPKADVVITGTCHAPGGRPVGSARVTVRIGPMRKALVVWGDRHFVEQPLGGHAPSEPVPFRAMPLGWERAFGGPGSVANPVGKGWAPPDAPRSRPLPNVELAGRPVRFPGDSPEPAGLGPIDARWSARASKLGTYDAAWLAQRWPDLPTDADWTYFNAAPEDQQVPYLTGDEAIVLEGLHPDRERLEAHLPGLRPRCFLKKAQPQGASTIEEVTLHLDTVAIDADEGRLVLVWRGLTPVTSREHPEVTDALLAVEALVDAPRPVSHYADDAAWVPAREDAGALADAEEAAARGGPAPIPPPRPTPDPEDLAEARALDETRDELRAAGADPALLQRLEGVTRAAVFHAILVEELQRAGSSGEAEEPPADAGPELDTMREELRQAGAEPALLAKLATATTTTRFLEILLGGLPAAQTPAETRQRADLVESLRALEAQDELSALRTEAARRAGRGDRLTRAEVAALLATGGSLAEANLTGLDLTGLTLRGAKLAGARLDRAQLAGCDLGGADLTGASARVADLRGARLEEVIAEGADLEGAQLAGADLTRAKLGGASLASAELDQARLDGADLTGARLELASLDGASLRETVAEGARLGGARLRKARAPGIQLRGADLTGADLGGATLDGAVLIACVLDGAQLVGASLRGAHLDEVSGADVSFRGADLVEARAPGATLPRAVLERAEAARSTWTSAVLTAGDFTGAGLEGAIASGADLSGATFDLARLQEIDLGRARLVGARLTRANLFRARLGGADLTDADCRASNLFECDLFEAVALRTRFERANLKRTCLDRGAP